MKKVVYSAAVLFVVMASMVSCKRVYNCNCSYNNKVVYSKDLGSMTAEDAKNKCSSYDTTIVGEKWNCTLY